MPQGCKALVKRALLRVRFRHKVSFALKFQAHPSTHSTEEPFFFFFFPFLGALARSLGASSCGEIGGGLSQLDSRRDVVGRGGGGGGEEKRN